MRILRRGIQRMVLLASAMSLIFAGGHAGAQTGFWIPKAQMSIARAFHGVDGVNGILYVVGGQPETTVEAYNPTTNSWTLIGIPPSLGSGHVYTGVLNGLIYASVGGYLLFRVYDPATNTWTTLTHFSPPRFGQGMGVVDETIYIVGGLTASGGTCTLARPVLAYDPTTDTWMTKKGGPATLRAQLGVAVIDGIIYAVGGRAVASNCISGPSLSTLEAYNPATNTWTTKAPMPTPRWGLGVGVLNGKLLAVGGINEAFQVLSTAEAYDPTTNTWTTLTPMPTARWGLDVGVVGGVAHTIGGIDSNSLSSASNEAFQMSAPSSCVGTGSSSIRGTVTDFRAPVAGVMVSLAGPAGCANTTTTNAQGSYGFPMLANATYTVTPSKAGCTFDPAFRNVTVAGGIVSANFKATCM